MELTVDDRIGVHNVDRKILMCDLAAALYWLKRLDGKNHTLLCVERVDGNSLLIGGGPERYVIALESNQASLTLKNIHSDSEKLIELCTGGQFAEFPESICAERDQSVEALENFFQMKELQLTWV